MPVNASSRQAMPVVDVGRVAAHRPCPPQAACGNVRCIGPLV
ncbi:hypothetical protein FHR53_001368 [Xanthomonas arboricola]